MFEFNPQKYKTEIKQILQDLKEKSKQTELDGDNLRTILKNHPKDGKELFSKDQLLKGYKLLVRNGELEKSQTLKDFLTTKPTRSISGVTPVTVLTKPYKCPGKCIYCPDIENMPKSYIPSEPGAQRAALNNFDPFTQTYNRLLALKKIGHPIDKIELIIIGGTFSAYPTDYQIWFVKECFRALNEFKFQTKSFSRRYPDLESASWEELKPQHITNETADSRCVGLSLETRPDCITPDEVLRMRRLGATKIQIGIQNLDNEILMKNKRGHGIEEIHSAFKLLRLAGFKIQAHWMPNLYSSTVKKDIGNYKKLWRNNSKGLHPDEIKIYPTSVIKGTKLFELCERGEYKPFTLKQLKAVLKQALIDTPRYCRISRVIRDIPQQEIEAGSKVTNLRQIIHQEMEKTGQKCECIRCREIRDKDYSMSQLSKEQIIYKTNSSTEYFLSFKTPEDNIVGFLRLCLPNAKLNQNHFISELKDSAIIREIHIYGQSREIGDRSGIAPQHKGLGKRLIDWAQIITIKNDLHKLSVISAVGTRKYYEKRGFEKGLLYMHKNLVQGQQL